MREGNYEPKGYGQVTTTGSAQALPTIPAGARVAVFKMRTAKGRFRDDGTDPSATLGVELDAGDEFFYTGKLSKVKFWLDSTAILDVAFYR